MSKEEAVVWIASDRLAVRHDRSLQLILLSAGTVHAEVHVADDFACVRACGLPSMPLAGGIFEVPAEVFSQRRRRRVIFQQLDLQMSK